MPGCGRHGCCGSACFFTTISAAGNLLPPTRSVDLSRDEVGRPLIPNRYTRGFEYSDCFVDDARLVVLTARDAADRGAEIRTRSRAVEIRQAEGSGRSPSKTPQSASAAPIQARALVNAGGPWVEQVLASGAGVNAKAKVRLVQGSHIVVPKLYAHDRAYMFQNSDGRIVFAIPYQDDFTLIGTTDRDYDGDPAKVKASSRGNQISLRFRQRISGKAGQARGRGVDLCRRASAL